MNLTALIERFRRRVQSTASTEESTGQDRVSIGIDHTAGSLRKREQQAPVTTTVSLGPYWQDRLEDEGLGETGAAVPFERGPLPIIAGSPLAPTGQPTVDVRDYVDDRYLKDMPSGHAPTDEQIQLETGKAAETLAEFYERLFRKTIEEHDWERWPLLDILVAKPSAQVRGGFSMGFEIHTPDYEVRGYLETAPPFDAIEPMAGYSLQDTDVYRLTRPLVEKLRREGVLE